MNIADSTYRLLEKFAKAKGVDKGTALTIAIQWADWLEETRAAGAHILLNKEGKTSELIFGEEP